MMMSWKSVISLLLAFMFARRATGFAFPKTSFLASTTISTKSSCLWYKEQQQQDSNDDDDDVTTTADDTPSSSSSSPPIEFTSPVLQQLYPNLLQHKEQYGHPNIPLGSKPGRQCNTIRRLHIQNKLTHEEINWLTEIGFTFHSLEDVYKDVPFDDLFDRLIQYEQNHPEHSNYQIPKKCVEDPELGAWVTGIRRLGPDGINPDHERRLNSINFAWKSTRKCGSKFMKQYREYVSQVEETNVSSVEDLLSNDPKVIKWIKAQQEALKRGSLSQTRVHYMEQLFGENWTTMR